jgi:hypothetical protein
MREAIDLRAPSTYMSSKTTCLRGWR